MIDLSDETRQLIDNAYADGVPCILGSASKYGHPQTSMKGSVLVFDRETLAYWERAKRSALENVVENPNVVIFYRNPEQRINWRFYGTATLHTEGPILEAVWERLIEPERERDSEKQGVRRPHRGRARRRFAARTAGSLNALID